MPGVTELKFEYWFKTVACAPSVRALLDHGWELGRFERGQGVRVWVGRLSHSMEDAQEFAPGEVDDVLRLVEVMEMRSEEPVVPLHWPEDGTSIEVYALPKSRIVVVRLDAGAHEIDGIEPVKDATWYLTRLLPALASLPAGLAGVVSEESFGPG